MKDHKQQVKVRSYCTLALRRYLNFPVGSREEGVQVRAIGTHRGRTAGATGGTVCCEQGKIPESNAAMNPVLFGRTAASLSDTPPSSAANVIDSVRWNCASLLVYECNLCLYYIVSISTSSLRCGESPFQRSTPSSPNVKLGRPNCSMMKEADTVAYKTAAPQLSDSRYHGQAFLLTSIYIFRDLQPSCKSSEECVARTCAKSIRSSPWLSIRRRKRYLSHLPPCARRSLPRTLGSIARHALEKLCTRPSARCG